MPSPLTPKTVLLCFTVPLASTLLAPPDALGGASPFPSLESGAGCHVTPAAPACEPLGLLGRVSSASDFVAGDQGARLRLADGSSADLEPHTVVRVGAATAIPLGTGQATRAQRLQLLSGKMIVRVSDAKTGGTAVLVRGPHASAVIVARGESVLSVRGDGLAVANLSGRALATSSKEWAEVAPRKARALGKDDAKPVYRDLVQAPKLAPSHTLTTSFGGASEPLGLAWEPVAGAARYVVDVVSRGEGALHHRSVAPETRLTLPSLPPGHYEARIHALDGDGLDGVPSAPVALTVVGIQVPPGAIVRPDGGVELAEGQALLLEPIDGVQVAPSADAGFEPAAPMLGLRSASEQLVRLRRSDAVAGSLGARIKLAPRNLRAEVTLGPKTARWPGDSIQVRIELQNAAGGEVPPGTRMVPEVRLGIVPLRVSWTEDGGALRAVIPPQPACGPAVLRVEVADQYGLFLGRNFLEIEPDFQALGSVENGVGEGCVFRQPR